MYVYSLVVADVLVFFFDHCSGGGPASWVGALVLHGGARALVNGHVGFA